MVQLGDEIMVNLVPKNEAMYPEIVKVQLMQRLPLDEKEVFIAKLLVLTGQDFGYQVGELLLVHLSYEANNLFAYCEKSIQEAGELQ